MEFIDWPRLYLDAWLRWFGLASTPQETGMLRVSHARDVASIHAEGGFSRGWDVAECEALIADSTVFGDGLFVGSHLAGFILTRRAGDEAEVLSIVISRSARGRGAGQALLAAHSDYLMLAGVRVVFLEVEAGNKAALALYAKAGFRQVGKRKSYYPMPDGSRATALVMRRDLA